MRALSIKTIYLYKEGLHIYMKLYIYTYMTILMQTDEDQPHAYIQTFVLKPVGVSFFVQHDIFRLALHNV